MSDLRIGVIGAGVVGLTTALELQKEFRGASVTVIADRFTVDTTSYVAAGLFRPGTSFAGPNEETTRKWIYDAYNYWDNIRASAEAPLAGVAEISGYIFSSTSEDIVKNRYIDKLVPVYRRATSSELQLCPGNWKYGSFFTTVLTECGLYLPWASEKYMAQGGRIQQRKITNLAEITSDYDITVNCSGLGAKYLCEDHKIVPMRGQVLKVKAPWIKTFFYGDYDTYIIPGFNTVTLGGCRQYDSYDLSISKYDGLAIRERCEALLPSLKGAELVRQAVGLRPHRDPVRVERGRIEINGKVRDIVHNYGHGGYGVTTAPGTAIHAVKLVKEALTGNSKL